MESKPTSWTRKSSKEVADCRVFSVREDECVRDGDSETASFYVIDAPSWVNVIASTTDQRIVLIEQFRHGVGEVVLEIPGGMVDDGEDPMTAAKRELEEETGYTSPIWMFLGKSQPNPAIQNNTLYHYLAANCIKTAEPSFDGHESIVTRLAGPEEVHDLIAKGKITHSLVVAAFYFLLAQSKITTS